MAAFDYDVVIIGFDITSGAAIHGPATEALNVYEVQEVDGSTRIRLY